MKHYCPRRSENESWSGRVVDYWVDDRTCSFCGSLRADLFLSLIQEGCTLTPTDKDYKVYVDETVAMVLGIHNMDSLEPPPPSQSKFYFQHLSEDERAIFRDLFIANKIHFSFPGYFYVVPAFLQMPRTISRTDIQSGFHEAIQRDSITEATSPLSLSLSESLVKKP